MKHFILSEMIKTVIFCVVADNAASGLGKEIKIDEIKTHLLLHGRLKRIYRH